jgi:hypothetical protein
MLNFYAKIIKKNNIQWKNLSGNDEHHDLIRRSPKLPGSKLYYKTVSELIGQNKKLKSIFNDASKYHKKHY